MASVAFSIFLIVNGSNNVPQCPIIPGKVKQEIELFKLKLLVYPFKTCLHICFLSPGLKNILPITTAKVPIVKFYHVRTGLEGDISLYNTLVGLGLEIPDFTFEEIAICLKTNIFFFRLYTTHTCLLHTLP